MAKYTIIKNNDYDFDIKEKTRTHTGVRWITINNIVDNCKTLEDAKKKYPRAKISDIGGEWFDNLCEKQNQIILNKGEY
jgi:hypothetical protein|tara:strand:+ start:172 stop:408 length:237 start_codon:yes stop_codon:yes gene_type:complete